MKVNTNNIWLDISQTDYTMDWKNAASVILPSELLDFDDDVYSTDFFNDIRVVLQNGKAYTLITFVIQLQSHLFDVSDEATDTLCMQQVQLEYDHGRISTNVFKILTGQLNNEISLLEPEYRSFYKGILTTVSLLANDDYHNIFNNFSYMDKHKKKQERRAFKDNDVLEFDFSTDENDGSFHTQRVYNDSEEAITVSLKYGDVSHKTIIPANGSVQLLYCEKKLRGIRGMLTAQNDNVFCFDGERLIPIDALGGQVGEIITNVTEGIISVISNGNKWVDILTEKGFNPNTKVVTALDLMLSTSSIAEIYSAGGSFCALTADGKVIACTESKDGIISVAETDTGLVYLDKSGNAEDFFEKMCKRFTEKGEVVASDKWCVTVKSANADYKIEVSKKQ